MQSAEEKAAYNAAYRSAHLEELKQSAKEYYQTHREERKQYRLAHREERIQYLAKWRSDRPDYYEPHKGRLRSAKDAPCVDCGGRFPPECMDFDHVRGTKSFNVGTRARGRWELLAAEIAKCEVVCANCHRTRTVNRRKKAVT